MMRLIDADELKKAITEATYNFEQIPIRVDKVQEIIDNAPTVKDRSLEIAQKSIELGRKVGQLEGKLERPQGDLISRTELKKCAIPCQIHNGALTDLCVPLYQINNAPTVERPQGEWTPVNIEVPKEKQKVLVTRENGEVELIRWNQWWAEQTIYPTVKVIAWMPAPEPYKKGGAE